MTPRSDLPAHSAAWLRNTLGLAAPDTPFAWQQELFARLMQGRIERFLDIPTGLGKTSVMALWLVARACGAKLPRRLVYVVDRRAVVDQATEVAKHLRRCVNEDIALQGALSLPTGSLPISTLRGRYVDNREWLEDPTSTAVIVGTVDMVGSRLFFEGYGTSRKMRPYQAGLLGADTLVVLDEAHLVPPFEKLLEAVAEGAAAFGPEDEALRALVPPFQLMSLSATGRAGDSAPFGLTEADLRPGTVTRKRLDATKRLTLHRLAGKKLEEALAEAAWDLTGKGAEAVRCIVFAHRRLVAEAVRSAVERLAKRDLGAVAGEVPLELFVGGRRVFEREEAARRLATLGFIAGTTAERRCPAFLFATSAAEVGVDLDADHMVCDLVAWERMVQRLGRVNRRGDGRAEVIVIREPGPVPSRSEKAALDKKPHERTDKQAKSVVKFEASMKAWEARPRPFERLPLLDDVARDASPGALRELKLHAGPDLLEVLEAATTPAPLRPALSRPLVDAWSMTSLKEHTGRPDLGPWLRGWVDDDRPQTAVVWRTHMPARSNGPSPTSKEIEAFFEAAPPHRSEILETETHHVVSWLLERAKALSKPASHLSTPSRQMEADAQGSPGNEDASLAAADLAAVVLGGSGDVRKLLRLHQIAVHEPDAKLRKKQQEELHRAMAGGIVVVDARLGGLLSGLLDAQDGSRPRTADDGAPWMPVASEAEGGAAPTTPAPVVPFRVRAVDDGQPATRDVHWRERLRFPAEVSDDGEVSRWLVIEKWRHDAATEEDRSAGRPQLLVEHECWAEDRARAIADRLDLPEPYRNVLRLAARLHDEGKKAKRWQRAFHAPGNGIYAKTRGPLNTALLDGYRHEFGSLPFAAKDPDLHRLDDDLRELALHLIAAHHGFARPVISTGGCEDAPPSALEERAREVAQRFARLQRKWGPWGLAWWEALLRAADQQASRDNDAVDSAVMTEAI